MLRGFLIQFATSTIRLLLIVALLSCSKSRPTGLVTSGSCSVVAGQNQCPTPPVDIDDSSETPPTTVSFAPYLLYSRNSTGVPRLKDLTVEPGGKREKVFLVNVGGSPAARPASISDPMQKISVNAKGGECPTLARGAYCELEFWANAGAGQANMGVSYESREGLQLYTHLIVLIAAKDADDGGDDGENDGPDLEYSDGGIKIPALTVPANGALKTVKLTNVGKSTAYKVTSIGHPSFKIAVTSNCPQSRELKAGASCDVSFWSPSGSGSETMGVNFEDASGKTEKTELLVTTAAAAPSVTSAPPPPSPATYSVTVQAINAKNLSQGLSGASGMGQSTPGVCHLCTVNAIPAGATFTVTATPGIRAWASCPGPMTAYTCQVTVTGNMTLSAEFY